MKAAYFVTSTATEHGFAVLAESADDAKTIAWISDVIPGVRLKDLRALCVPAANIEGRPLGAVMENKDALCIGIYDFIRAECDGCHREGKLTCYEGHALCEDCIWEIEHEGDDDIYE